MKIKNNKVVLYSLIAIAATLLGIVLIITLTTGDSKEEQNRKKVLEEHGYELPSNIVKSELAEFDNLVANFSSETPSEEEYAKSIGKLFVIDFFTWTNKEGRYDVGGVEYIALGFGANFRLAAVNSFYYNMNDYVDEYGKINLLEVDTIEVTSIEKTEFQKPDGTNYREAYKMKISWTYTQNEVFDNSKFQTKTHITVVMDDDNKYRVAYFLRD